MRQPQSQQQQQEYSSLCSTTRFDGWLLGERMRSTLPSARVLMFSHTLNARKLFGRVFRLLYVVCIMKVDVAKAYQQYTTVPVVQCRSHFNPHTLTWHHLRRSQQVYLCGKYAAYSQHSNRHVRVARGQCWVWWWRVWMCVDLCVCMMMCTHKLSAYIYVHIINRVFCVCVCVFVYRSTNTFVANRCVTRATQRTPHRGLCPQSKGSTDLVLC